MADWGVLSGNYTGTAQLTGIRYSGGLSPASADMQIKTFTVSMQGDVQADPDVKFAVAVYVGGSADSLDGATLLWGSGVLEPNTPNAGDATSDVVVTLPDNVVWPTSTYTHLVVRGLNDSGYGNAWANRGPQIPDLDAFRVVNNAPYEDPSVAWESTVTVTGTRWDPAANAFIGMPRVNYTIDDPAVQPPTTTPPTFTDPGQLDDVSGVPIATPYEASTWFTAGSTAINQYELVFGTYPSGVSIDPASGVIDGTPSGAQSYNMQVTATQLDGAFTTGTVTWVVAVGKAEITFIDNPAVNQNELLVDNGSFGVTTAGAPWSLFSTTDAAALSDANKVSSSSTGTDSGLVLNNGGGTLYFTDVSDSIVAGNILYLVLGDAPESPLGQGMIWPVTVTKPVAAATVLANQYYTAFVPKMMALGYEFDETDDGKHLVSRPEWPISLKFSNEELADRTLRVVDMDNDIPVVARYRFLLAIRKILGL